MCSRPEKDCLKQQKAKFAEQGASRSKVLLAERKGEREPLEIQRTKIDCINCAYMENNLIKRKANYSS